MKRFLSIMLVAVLIVTSFTTVAFAAGSADASVSKSQTVHAGDTVTLTVTVSGEFSNYEATMKADDGLTITGISGITANISNGKVAFSSASNQSSHSFTVTVKVADNAKPGTYKVKADVTYGSMIVPVEQDTEDGIPDGLIRVSLGDGSATLTVVCDHAWGEWVVTKEPTCTEKGEETRVCSVCGEKETRPLDMIDHNWSAWTVTKAPTCTEKGEETRTCSICGEKETRPVDMIPHNWGEWVVTEEPTCKKEGTKTRECSICHETETEKIAKTQHNWGEWVVTEEPTCTKEGTKTRECSICHETETEKIAKTEHKWGQWTETQAPNCTDKGEMTRTCSVCGEKETKEIDALGHKFDHTVWKGDDFNHWHECTVCGCKCEHNAPHTVTEWQIIKQPTATETGLKQKLCEVCGAVIATEEIPANGEGTLDPVPPTGDPTGMLMAGSMSFLLLILLAVALYIYKRKAATK